MVRKVVLDRLVGTGLSPACIGWAKQVTGSAEWLVSTSTHALQACPSSSSQQHHSSTSTHICSSRCSCDLQREHAVANGCSGFYEFPTTSCSSSSKLFSRSGRDTAGLWSAPQHYFSSATSGILPSAQRGFASVSRASAHSGCGHSHHHDEPCADETTAQIRQSHDLQQLQQLVQQTSSSSSMTAGQTAAAFRRAAVLAEKTPAAADAVLALLAPVWPGVLAQAGGKDLADVLLSWTKLQTQDEGLWGPTLAAIPAQIKVASGQDLANIAYALAAMSDINGGIPGVSRPDVQELLRLVTEEVVSLVQGKPAADGCGDGRAVSVGNLATVRWAHEVFEESAATGSG